MKIFNLSSHTLTTQETILLTRGLTFAPTNLPNAFQLFKDLNKFIRDLTLKRFYNIKAAKDASIISIDTTSPSSAYSNILDEKIALDILEELYHEGTGPFLNPDNPESDALLYTQHLNCSPAVKHTNFRPLSNFYPTQSKGPCLETFYRMVYSELLMMCQQQHNPYKNHNLTYPERLALNLLKTNENVIIKSADKGGSFVLQNWVDYIKEAIRLLGDSKTSTKLQEDPLPSFTIDATILVNQATKDNVITKNEASFLVKKYHQTPYFYHLPKVHKSTTNPPGRPIVASMNSITSGFSQYVDLFLQPFVSNLQSHIKDGIHLLELLGPYQWEPNYIWLSLDVQSLYTSIPHNVGMQAIQHFLSEDPSIHPNQVKFILDATFFCLTHNYFIFEDHYYLQTHGTAMGTNFAPSYANLTMGLWETRYIWANNPFMAKIIFYGRYIDDIIIIWDGNTDDIESFVSHCNDNNMGLSFTSVHDKTHLAFLDLDLFHDTGRIHAKNYCKPTAGNSYLHYNSCHHPRWLKNIPKSQFCRLRHNCTMQSDYQTQSINLKQKFIEKGYPPSLIEQAYTTYVNPDTHTHKMNSSKDIRFTTQFHNKYKNMEHIVHKHWPILLQDPHLKDSIPNKPKFSYRKAPNIKGKIAPSKLKKKTNTSSSLQLFFMIGMYQCRKPLCLTCSFVQHGQKTFTIKNKTYKISEFYTCSTDHVVYCLTCPCGLHYVGRTIRPLRQRFGEHRRFIEAGKDHHSVPRHFTQHHPKSTVGLKVWIIESIPATLPAAERFKRLCQRETYWIYALDVLSPGGINEELEISTLL